MEKQKLHDCFSSLLFCNTLGSGYFKVQQSIKLLVPLTGHLLCLYRLTDWSILSVGTDNKLLKQSVIGKNAYRCHCTVREQHNISSTSSGQKSDPNIQCHDCYNLLQPTETSEPPNKSELHFSSFSYQC